MSRFVQVALGSLFLLQTPVSRAETLDRALREVARETARILRADDRTVANLVPPESPRGRYFGDRLRVALRAEGIVVAGNGTAAARIEVHLRGGPSGRAVDVRVVSPKGGELGTTTRRLELDDAADVAILDGRSFDATARGTASRLAVLEALSDRAAPILERGHPSKPTVERPAIVVRTLEDGSVSVSVDGAEIVVRPEGPAAGEAGRWRRHRRYERR